MSVHIYTLQRMKTTNMRMYTILMQDIKYTLHNQVRRGQYMKAQGFGNWNGA